MKFVKIITEKPFQNLQDTLHEFESNESHEELSFSDQLKFGNVTFPPQVLTHVRTKSRKTVVNIHHSVHKAVECRS